MEKDLNILIQSSDYYAPFAGVMLTSLFENNKAAKHITIYLMTSDMSEKNRNSFSNLANQYKRFIKFLDTIKIDQFLEAKCVPKYRDSYATYYKIFALAAIDDEIDRLIYLDSDMVITGPLLELMTLSLNDNLLGMCIDAIQSKHKKLIGCNSKYYYNAGMIIFDVKKWNYLKCADKIIEHMVGVHTAYPIVDQDLLNIVFSGQIAVVPQKYNCYPVIFLYKEYKFLKKSCGIIDFYSEEEVEEAKRNPVVLHCLEEFGLRPWHEGKHTYKEMWGKYLKISPWSDFIFLKCDAPIASKIQRLLFKCLPENLFSIINRNCVYILLVRNAWKLGLLT